MRITERTDREQRSSIDRSFISKKRILPMKKEIQHKRFYIYN
jgi:hypothetical protein